MYLNSSALLVDQYQLSMMEAYIQRDMNKTAVFELFVRRLPKERNFLVATGLEQALELLESLHFTPEELKWLKQTGKYSQDFLAYLADFKFRGDVDAMPEGTLFFPNEPILQIIASMAEAQFIESRIINLLHYQTLVASKAVRSVLMGPGKTLIDFGVRRSHGFEAGVLAARASYIAGFTGTSTVLAERAFQIPAFGTMAHSFIEAHSDENLAFQNFAEVHPENVIFLLDTYDTIKAAHKICKLAPALVKQGIKIKGVRLDSGDLAELSKQVREILNSAGLEDTIIFVSGDLDEHKVHQLLANGAPIDAFGVGTHLTTSTDAPYLDMVYKLQAYDGIPKRKKSIGKATWPGKKQVFRTLSADSTFASDVVALESETIPGATPLLQPVMRKGKRLHAPSSVAEIRKAVLKNLEQLPTSLKSLSIPSSPYPVEISEGLKSLIQKLDLN